MSKYKLRYFIAVGVLLALPAFTCGVGPVLRDLIQRVEMLEAESALLTGQVGALEADVDLLREEIDALAAEVDAAPIVIDSNGEILGPALVINSENESAQVQFDLPDVPLFFLAVAKGEILASLVAPLFESDDCSGQAWVNGSDGTRGVTAYVKSNTSGLTGIRTFYVADPSESPQMISCQSRATPFGGCEPAAGTGHCAPDGSGTSAARATPVDLDAMFTPPFHGVLSADLHNPAEDAEACSRNAARAWSGGPAEESGEWARGLHGLEA